MTHREPALITPFWVRIAAETSLSPGWLLIAFPAVLYPAYLALEALFGRGVAAAMDFEGGWVAVAPLRMTATLGFQVMMLTYLARGTFSDLEALRPVLQGGQAAYADLREQFTHFERRRLWIAALAGVVFVCVFQEIGPGRWTRLLAGDWSLRDSCLVVMFFGSWILSGWAAVYLIDSVRVYSRIGERQVTVDLIDLGPLLPLTRHGLRTVLLVAIGSTAMIIYVVVYSAPLHSSYVAIMLLLPVGSLPVAAAAFLLPVRGLRRQIRARKAEELARVREEIRLDRDLVAQRGPDSAEAGARLPALLAFEKRIESVREWPFDAPTLTRFFLYAAIPLGSWIGGALVERLLGAALD